MKDLHFDEDLLEQLYWEFDTERKRSGAERDVFKGKMRYFATYTLYTNEQNSKESQTE